MKNKSDKQAIRILFLTWGFSIHAQRRIQIFIDDPGFKVAVASTYEYHFQNALSIPLSKSFSPNNSSRLLKTRKILYDVNRLLTDLKILKKFVKEFWPDFIFLQTLLYPCYLAYLLPRSIPHIITFWNGDVTWFARRNGIERLFKKQIVAYGINRANKITVNSKPAYQACKHFGAHANKLSFITYPGVDTNIFKPIDQVVAKDTLGYKHKNIILCPRGIGGYFNSDIIIETSKRIIRKYPDTIYLFLSANVDPLELTKIERFKSALGFEKNICIVGEVPWEEMPLYYNASDMMISISTNDSLPNCMLESMACGTPLIMGDIPATREWIKSGKNGFLVPPRDSKQLCNTIEYLFDNLEVSKETFNKINFDLIRQQFDCKINAEKVKNVVKELRIENTSKFMVPS